MVTLEEVFRKSQDNLTKSFDAEKFSSDIENLSKAETEWLLGQIQAEILKGGDYNTLTEMRDIALGNIEKARSGVYADTSENRKLGRVGQQYGGKSSRGGKQTEGLGSNSVKKIANAMYQNSKFASRIESLLSEHLGDELKKKYGTDDFADIFDKVGEDNYGKVVMNLIRKLPVDEVQNAYNSYFQKK